MSGADGGTVHGMATDHLTLSGSDVAIPRLGVGTWAWGDESTWGMGGYDTDLTRDSIADAWAASLDAGVTLFDTAEVYGGGESERIIGSLLAADPDRAARAVVATKFMPSPWKLDVRRALLASLRASLARLGLEAVDLYQLHGPVSLRSHAALAAALAAAHGEGLVRAVGVSNYSVKETRAMAAAPSSATGCAWPPTRSSSRSCGGPRRRAACSPPAPTSAWCPWPTRRSGRDA